MGREGEREREWEHKLFNINSITMKQSSISIQGIITFLILALFNEFIIAQCTPPMAEECEQASVLCSLDEVNGYSCNNPSTVPSPCSPLCSQGGVGHNTSWWAFVCQGGNVTITLTNGGCTTNQGLQYGVWGDCVCGEEVICRSIPCIPPNSISVVSANLTPCKTYFLWVDGCSGDICDFTLNTAGGGPPGLVPLSKINNKANMIIEPVCVGTCNYKFFVNPQPGGCEPTYVWTLDGDEVGGNKLETRLDFPDEGDFVICVTAYIGNPQSGSVCSQEGPQCATVKVRPIADKTGKLRKICHDAAMPGGFKWHSQRIFTSGIYREQFSDSICCKFDSIVEFEVLPPPPKGEYFFIGCDNQPYVDILGRTYPLCNDRRIVDLPMTSDPFLCDSGIILTTVNVEFGEQWKTQCVNDRIEHTANVSLINPCNLGETHMINYRWYLKKDSLKKTISTDEHLLVSGAAEDYCFEVSVQTQFHGLNSICTKTFCDPYYEGEFGVFAGRDSKQKGLIAQLNAASRWKGEWKLISGTGKAIFEKSSNARSRVRVDDYGVYCFEWTANESVCIPKDTVCIEFYKIKTTTPDYPKKNYDDRSDNSVEVKDFFSDLYTPNLISGNGTSYVSFDREMNSAINYSWIDNTGKVISKDKVVITSGLKQVNIISPVQEGLYFVVFEIEGVTTVRKVCVIE
jgi:hypothetical protein